MLLIRLGLSKQNTILCENCHLLLTIKTTDEWEGLNSRATSDSGYAYMI